MVLTGEKKRSSNKSEMTINGLIEKIEELGLESIERVVVSEIEGTETRLVTDNRTIAPEQLKDTLRRWDSESISRVMLLDMTPVYKQYSSFSTGQEEIYRPPAFSIQITRVSNGAETIVVAVKSIDL
ncbi:MULTISPECIES: hypothetical protein [unclassified Mesotoga]|jgi:hypothetical protein|uniref:hypothetical protein n=1 Tax=unclassified Mesotoga TaxID=1184398 RepID=UPI000CC8A5EB|nr:MULTISPECIES: hypothetical protein [unclassified Mesotoga]PNQ06321.1 hypothetical protein RM69_00130 [Mesotoga sp. SC_NapDC3]PXF35682.1 hypothetical protein EU77_00450 [Mesotoga sp. SC_NapDC]